MGSGAKNIIFSYWMSGVLRIRFEDQAEYIQHPNWIDIFLSDIKQNKIKKIKHKTYLKRNFDFPKHCRRSRVDK